LSTTLISPENCPTNGVHLNIHHDTTTVKLCGAYDAWHNEPKADRGHSKDHRPDLKQLVLGLNVTGDGAVPISQLISFELDKRIVVSSRYASTGRPSKNSARKILRKTEFCIKWSIDKEEVSRQSRTDGVFPLITNNMDKSTKEVLTTYKFQSFLENRHSPLKSVLQIAPVFLKKPSRVLSLVDIIVLSLVVATLIERDSRKGMRRNKIESLPVYPEQRECKYPTMQSVIRVFSDVEKYELRDKDGKETEYFPPALSALQNQILDLMGVPQSIFM
jgi:transposase